VPFVYLHLLSHNSHIIVLVIFIKFNTRKNATAPISIATAMVAVGKVVAASANALTIIEAIEVGIKQPFSMQLHISLLLHTNENAATSKATAPTIKVIYTNISILVIKPAKNTAAIPTAAIIADKILIIRQKTFPYLQNIIRPHLYYII